MSSMPALRPLLALALLAGCAEDDTATAEGIARAEKVDVCHNEGSGSFHVISVAPSAVAAHLGNHGDHLAGTFYADADGDGAGDPGLTSECMDDGFVANDDDCDDSDDTTHAGAEEVCDDGVDNDCDGEVDEDCTATVDIFVAGDNALWVWVDGAPVALSSSAPDWGLGRSASLELATGQDHAVAVYVEDWGGLAYFAGSVRVDGAVVSASGAGDFSQTTATVPYGSDSYRIANWASQPDDAGDAFTLLFDPSTSTWGDWMLPGFDDSAWGDDTNVCTNPGTWNTAHFATYYPGFSELLADGAAFTWPQTRWPAGTCSSNGWAATAYRTEISL